MARQRRGYYGACVIYGWGFDRCIRNGLRQMEGMGCIPLIIAQASGAWGNCLKAVLDTAIFFFGEDAEDVLYLTDLNGVRYRIIG